MTAERMGLGAGSWELGAGHVLGVLRLNTVTYTALQTALDAQSAYRITRNLQPRTLLSTDLGLEHAPSQPSSNPLHNINLRPGSIKETQAGGGRGTKKTLHLLMRWTI